MKKIKKAVIPIAGFGTRFLPFTKAVPKEMLPIVDTPVIHFIVQEAIASGIEEILFITNNQKKTVEDYFDRNYELEGTLLEKNASDKLIKIPTLEQKVKIYFMRQREAAGSGAAVRLAADFVGDEYFAVLYGDDLFFTNPPALKQLMAICEKKQCSVLGCKEISDSQKYLYGIIECDETGRVQNFHEKPKEGVTNSNLASLGRYILSPNIFAKITDQYQNGKEVYLTDAFLRLMKEEEFVTCTIAGRHYDTGNKSEYVKAVIDYAKEHAEIKEDIKKYIEKAR